MSYWHIWREEEYIATFLPVVVNVYNSVDVTVRVVTHPCLCDNLYNRRYRRNLTL